MAGRMSERSPLVYARAAGVLYLIIIVFGLFGEIFVRSSLVSPGDAATTASNILASKGLFRAGFLADSIMLLSDMVLAVLLFVLLRPVGRTAALVALVFRLAQAAVLALNLLNYYAAVLLLTGAGYASAFEEAQVHSLSSLFLDLHSHGYDLGLILFGVHCLILGYLIAKSLFLPKALGYMVMAAGVTYLVGSYTRFLFPDFVDAMSPIYLIAIVSEFTLCSWLLARGVNLVRWKEVTGSVGVA